MPLKQLLSQNIALFFHHCGKSHVFISLLTIKLQSSQRHFVPAMDKCLIDHCISFLCCYITLSQTQGLKTTLMYYLTVWQVKCLTNVSLELNQSVRREAFWMLQERTHFLAYSHFCRIELFATIEVWSLLLAISGGYLAASSGFQVSCILWLMPSLHLCGFWVTFLPSSSALKDLYDYTRFTRIIQYNLTVLRFSDFQP